MARIRTVKPELFLDEELGTLSGDHALLFVGLWTLADREGRLAYRPGRIKASLFPYRQVEIAALVEDLEGIGKVQTYMVEDELFLWVPGFTTHQRPHPKEPKSELPMAPSREKKRLAVERLAAIPSSPVGREGKGREGDLGREPTAPASSAAADPVPPKPPEPSAPKPDAPDALQAAWNAEAHPDLPRWREMPPTRRRTATARLKDRPLDGPAGWRAVIARISASAFCRGANDRGWRASPDWLLQPEVGAKVLEGKYDGKSESKSIPARREATDDEVAFEAWAATRRDRRRPADFEGDDPLSAYLAAKALDDAQLRAQWDAQRGAA